MITSTALHALLRVKAPAEIDQDQYKSGKKNKQITIYRQRVLWIPDLRDLTESHPFWLDLKPDSEPMHPGYYCYIQTIEINRFKTRLELAPFGKIKVSLIGQDPPESQDQLIELAKEANHYKSVLEKPDFGDETPPPTVPTNSQQPPPNSEDLANVYRLIERLKTVNA